MNKHNWMTLRRTWQMCVAFLLAGVALAGHAQTVVESVSSSIQGGVEVVRVDFSKPLDAVPAGFAIQAPARIALDIPGASNGLGRSTVDINQGNVRSVNVVQAGERTRLVLNLKSPTAYKAELLGKSLLVSLTPVANAAPAPSSTPAFAESRPRSAAGRNS